jgi:hypothetical protein
METQLRDYLIKPGHMDDWLAGWRAGILPLREQEGFRILGAWVDRPHDRFVWLVGYDRDDGFVAADERYHALPARLSIDPEPSGFIAEARLDMVETVR